LYSIRIFDRTLTSSYRIVGVRLNTDVINDRLVHCTFSLHSELIQERREKIVDKFDCCHNLLWQLQIDSI